MLLFFYMIDLHTHSSASDGSLTPAQLVHYAANQGVRVLALTDHDTAEGLSSASIAAEAAGITLVPGIELNIDWPSGEFHLLGLGLKTLDSSLAHIITFLQEGRLERNLNIIQKMNTDGYKISLDEICNMFQTHSIGRPHFADYFVAKKIVKNRQQAFDRFLAKDRPYFIGRKGSNLDDSVAAIVKSGGIPVLAHPLSLYVSWSKITDVLIDLKNRGIVGLEAWHPGVRVVEAERLQALAHDLDFLVTAGSDFHGEKIRVDRKIGYTSGQKKITEQFISPKMLHLLGIESVLADEAK